jgi:transposase-like protein
MKREKNLEQIMQLMDSGESLIGMSRALGIPRTTLRRWVSELRETSPHFRADRLPDGEIDIQDILTYKRKVTERKLGAYQQRAVDIKIKLQGPVGILHFGDPHIDDDGTDLKALERDMALVKQTDGLLCGNLGDTTNNWVGRLARLFSEQTTTARQAVLLAKWFIEELSEHMVYMIGGNHDMWSGATDPLRWFTAHGPGIYKPHQALMSVTFPNKRKITMRAHHQFKGHSQWNTAHSISKAATMGYRDNILLAGHRHISGYQQVVDPSSGLISHCIQVGSYKIADDYPQAHGMIPQQISPSVVTVIDPDAQRETALVQVFTDTELAADFLKFKRRKIK